MGPLLMLLLLNPITVGAGTLYVIGQMSRWFELADAYPVKAEFSGRWQSSRSVVVNGISFNRCIDIGENEDYLFLQPRMLIDMVCKPVQIPWSSFKSVKPAKKFWIEMLRIELTNPDIVIMIPRSLLDMKNPNLLLDAPLDIDSQ